VWLPEGWSAVGVVHTVRLGILLIVPVAIVYAAWTGGWAWIVSRGPALHVERDRIVDQTHSMFRLRVQNSGDDILEPNATLESVRTSDGRPYRDDAQLPGLLEWTHLPQGTRPALSRHESATCAIAYVAANGVAFAIEHYRLDVLEDCTCDIRITVPGTRKQVLRQFRISHDDAAPLKWRCETLE
jgi:hypothetical protein